MATLLDLMAQQSAHLGSETLRVPDTPQNRKLLGKDEAVGKLLKMLGADASSGRRLDVYYVPKEGARREHVWFADKFHTLWEWRGDAFTTGEYAGRHRVIPE